MAGGQFDLDFLDIIDTEQKAYIIGFLQCDGSFSCKTKDKKSYYRYKLSIQGADKGILEKMQAYTNHSGKLTVQKRKIEHHQDLYELSFNGRGFVEKLAKTFGGYSKEERINIPAMDDALLTHYIRGMFDADGSFGDYDGVMFRVDGKYELLCKMAEILGYSSHRIKKGNGKSTYTFRLSGDNAMAAAQTIYGGLSNESLFLQRKYDRIAEVLINRGYTFEEAV